MRLHFLGRAWTVENFQALLAFFVDMLPRLLDAERASVVILEPGTRRVLVRVGTGSVESGSETQLPEGIVKRAIEQGECVTYKERRKSPRDADEQEHRSGLAAHTAICVPLKTVGDDVVAGAVEIVNKHDPDGFDDDDQAVLEDAARHLVMTLEPVLLHEEIKEISRMLDLDVSEFHSAYLGDVPIVSESEAMRDVLDLVHTVRETPVNVVISGEKGTGKEVIARLIHERSPRREAPFVVINCAAVPEALVASELFGYEKGAFQAATSARPGGFEEALGGILYLEEVGALPMSVQADVLRAIEQGEGSRIGSEEVVSYDVRVICTTSGSPGDLKERVERGEMLEPLYRCLSTVEIAVPPLRGRGEDVVPLAHAFLGDMMHRYGKQIGGFTPELLASLERYAWPGNVRQLRHEIERLVALTPENDELRLERCSPELVEAPRESDGTEDLKLPVQVRHLEMELIARALDRTGGNKLRAAELLGITRQGLHKKLRRYGIGNIERRKTSDSPSM